MNTESIIDEIIKDCYWDYNISSDDIKSIIESHNFRMKKKLFSRIMYNSRDRLKSLSIFDKEELKELFDSFSASYNKRYINRQIKILRNILFGENNYISGLEWKK